MQGGGGEVGVGSDLVLHLEVVCEIVTTWGDGTVGTHHAVLP